MFMLDSREDPSTTGMSMSMGGYARSTSVRMVNVQPILQAISYASSNLTTRSGNYFNVLGGCLATVRAEVLSDNSHKH